MVRVCARTISILSDVCTTSGDAKINDSYASDLYIKITPLLQQKLQFLLLLRQ